MLLEAAVERRIRSARLRRSRPLARPAIASGEASPAISARSIARPDTPKTSEATLASLMLAVFKELQQPVAFGRLALTSLRR